MCPFFRLKWYTNAECRSYRIGLGLGNPTTTEDRFSKGGAVGHHHALHGYLKLS